VTAVLCIGTVLYVWSAEPSATDQIAFGRAGSLSVLAVAVLVSVVGAVASYLPRDTSVRLRWGVALPAAVVGAVVIVLAVSSLAHPRHSVDVVLDLVLLLGAIALEIVAIVVGRRRAVVR
jgi:hypothetical protein